MVDVPPVDLEWLVLLVNEFGPQPRAAADESDNPYPDLTGPNEPEVAKGVDDVLRIRVAEQLWPVFEPADPAVRAGILNELLRDARLAPAIDAAGLESWGTAHRSACGRLAAGCAVALRDAVGRYGWDRLGVCDGWDCVDVYIDRQTRAVRRYCSTTCLNRARVRAYRGRRT